MRERWVEHQRDENRDAERGGSRNRSPPEKCGESDRRHDGGSNDARVGTDHNDETRESDRAR